MSLRHLSFDVARCQGHFEGVAFGTQLNETCIDCARRLQTEHGERQSWTAVAVLSGECEHKLKDGA